MHFNKKKKKKTHLIDTLETFTNQFINLRNPRKIQKIQIKLS